MWNRRFKKGVLKVMITKKLDFAIQKLLQKKKSGFVLQKVKLFIIATHAAEVKRGTVYSD